MQNLIVVELENKFSGRIKKVAALRNLVNVVVFNPEEFKKHTGSIVEVFEIKTASTAQFVSFLFFAEYGYVVATEKLPVQVPDAPKK